MPISLCSRRAWTPRFDERLAKDSRLILRPAIDSWSIRLNTRQDQAAGRNKLTIFLNERIAAIDESLAEIKVRLMLEKEPGLWKRLDRYSLSTEKSCCTS